MSNQVKKKVVIVSQGRATGKAFDYLMVALVVKEVLLKPADAKRLLEVEVVPTIEEVQALAQVDSLVFVTGELIERAKAFKHQHPRTNIVVLTALAGQNQLQDGIHVLEKPFDSQTLRRFV